MLAYVSSLYAVRDDYLPTLFRHFQQLIALLQAPLYVFTDHDIPFALPPHVHILRQHLSDFQTYRVCMEAYEGRKARLPAAKNDAKDTAAFMALMNTKLEMVWRAVPFIPQGTTHIAWIDAGIMKIVGDEARIRRAFADQVRVGWSPHTVTIPGCWPTPQAPSSDAICWRFCGGFFVVPVAILDAYYGVATSMLEAWLRAGHLVWETNIWAAVEWKERAWYTWWGADHNETMLEPPGFLTRI